MDDKEAREMHIATYIIVMILFLVVVLGTVVVLNKLEDICRAVACT